VTQSWKLERMSESDDVHKGVWQFSSSTSGFMPNQNYDNPSTDKRVLKEVPYDKKKLVQTYSAEKSFEYY